MARPAKGRRAGFTMVEMMTVVLIILVLMALLLGGLSRASRSRTRTGCLNNLRQLGLGFSQYVAESNALPSVHTNIWAIVGVHVGQRFNATGNAAFAANRNEDIGEIYRCPVDMFRIQGTQGGSYAPNCQDAPPAAPTGPDGPDEFNWRYSPWSNLKLTPAGVPIVDPNRFLVMRSPGDAGPDTILLIECWSNQNIIDVTQYQAPPLAPLGAYLLPGHIMASAAQPVLRSAADAGTYRPLAPFGDRAAGAGGGVAVSRSVYHDGLISVLYADLHAALSEAVNLTHKPPVHWPPPNRPPLDPADPYKDRSPFNVPQWTREAD